MLHRNLVLGLVLALAVSCAKKSSSSEESTPEQATADQATDKGAAPAEETAVDGPTTDPAFLVGKWVSDCVNQPGFLQASVVVQYDFTADGNASSKVISYAGANCTKRFTKADVDAIKTQINADRAIQSPPAAPLNAAELAELDALWFPPLNAFTFKLGKTLIDQTVEMNYSQKIGDQTINTYVTIFVEENNLYFAEVCRKDDLDNGRCNQIVGDSVKNRARDMTNAIPFHKM
ncbi:MAG TPA: hypothetical protein VFO10_01220 [Oligoflexus sp.]|uniref:hypothetical protein n=1 Tax=Oligoflexus sp. TaxID=1971216 RepID=UPI002D7E5D3F|nr:hypothetical protein [Oligoflexus sp.]HET9235837.1 hypothetical protein [Oligoflexus sp.]